MEMCQSNIPFIIDCSARSGMPGGGNSVWNVLVQGDALNTWEHIRPNQIPAFNAISLFSVFPGKHCEADQAGSTVDPAGCVQVAKETLPKSVSNLQWVIQTAWHNW